MYLKEIELDNFKSFNRKVRLPFLRGYTAVTGPNGSGKSNISDAVLFVLGPRSNKAIRAGRLTDLIWNGGKEKRGASYTEVSLVFDNSDRLIPVDSDEVKLTRWVGISPSDKEGYNSYFYINERKSTLAEFDSLLAHARISADGYNFVQQGDIQRVVQMSAVDRRRLLDSIAGITKFDDDIGAADAKRKQTEENLGRIQIILDEIANHLKQLGADREGALKYRELKERLDTAKAQMAYKNRDLIQEQAASTRGQLDSYENERTQLLAKKADLQGQVDAAVAKLSDVEREIAERGGEEAKQLKVRLDGLRIERARAGDGIETSTEAIRRAKLELAEAQKERARHGKEIEALQKERTAFEARLQELEKSLHAAESDLKGVDEVASKSDAKVYQIQKEVVALSKKVDELEEGLKALILDHDRSQEGAGRLADEIHQLEELRKTYQVELEDAEFQLKDLRTGTRDATKDLQKGTQEYHAKRKEEAELTKQQSELQQAILSLTREYTQLKAESEVAENLKRGYTAAVAAILDARDTGRVKGIHGTIAQLGHVDPKNETAIVVAAGNRMQAIVVDDDSVAATCIDYIKKQRAGRATFLPLNKMLVGRPRGKAILVAKESIGFAIDQIAFDEKYRDAFFYVFGDTIVLKDLDEARKFMGGVRLVTLGGELIEASGAMVGGELERPALRFGAVDRGSLEKVAERLRTANEEAERVAKRLERLRAELSVLEARLKDLGGQTSTVDVKASAIEAKRKEFAAKLRTIDDDLGARSKQLKEKERASKTAGEAIDRLQGDLAKLRTDRDARKNALLEATPHQIADRMKELMGRRVKAADEASEARAKLEALATQLNVYGERVTETDRRIEGLGAQRSEQEKRVEDLEATLKKVETEIRGLEKMESSMSKQVKDLQDARDAAYKEKTDLEGALDKLGHRLETREDYFLKLQTELKVQEKQLAEAEQVLAEVQADIDAAKLPTLEELKRTIAECDAQIQALGNINLRALDDYDAQQKRHDELTSEYTQCEGQRKELIGLAQELSAKKKDGLMKVFGAIHENFKRVYEELSEGGEAELVLENEEDPFLGGLLLRAKPPHKKVLRLEALSGGEKSLVSMAFIFALQEYDPSPFYLLDEVDQNLDAVNAERVGKMIKKMSASAQTLQISLRKVTLKEADHLVGATMTPDGSSQIIMRVNLEDVEDEKPQVEEVSA